MAKASKFKIGVHLASEKAHIKSHRNTKVGLELPKIWQFPWEILINSGEAKYIARRARLATTLQGMRCGRG